MYGYAAPFYSNPIYYILLVTVLILSVYAQIKVSSTFKRTAKYRTAGALPVRRRRMRSCAPTGYTMCRFVPAEAV